MSLAPPVRMPEALAAPLRQATLYVLRAAREDIFKVGRTTVPLERRVAQLNTGAALKLTAVASFAVPSSLICKCETLVHASLRDLAAPEAGGKEFFRGQEFELVERTRGAVEQFLSFANAAAAAAAAPHDAIKLADIFEQRCRLLAELRMIEVRKTLIEDVILPLFQEGYFGAEGRPLLSWTKRSSERFDLEAFKKDHPKLAEEYTRTRVVRVSVFH